MGCLQFVIIFGKILIYILLSLLPLCMYSGLNEGPSALSDIESTDPDMSPFTSLNFIAFQRWHMNFGFSNSLNDTEYVCKSIFFTELGNVYFFNQ
jgi:hypothetical protein